MSDNRRVGGKIEGYTLDLETQIEKNIYEIKAYHVQNITSLDIKISDIASINTSSYSEPISTNINICTK